MKEDLRDRLRRIMSEIPREGLLARSAEACYLLIETPEYRRAKTIMVFLSAPHEVDTTSTVLHAWRSGRQVLAPKVIWEERRILPTEIHSLHQDLSEANVNLREPVVGPTVPVGEIDLVVLPGLGFDSRGYRLGRGPGFYERFLAHRDYRACTCALALEEQFIYRIPGDPDGLIVDMLVTDQVVRRFKSVPARKRPA